MRKFILSIIIISLSTSCYSQKMDINYKVREFLVDRGELSANENADIYIADLLRNEKYDGKDGFYTFVVLGSHKLPYIAYFSDTNINFLENYRLEQSLDWFVKELNKVSGNTPLEKTTLLENFAKILKRRELMNNSLSTDEKIDY